MSRMLGKLPPRFDARTLRMSRYMRAVPAPPVSVSYERAIPEWGMLLNDTLGDCVCAAAGHMEMQWTTYAGIPFLPTDGDIEKAYELIGGYVPGDPTTDQGCDMLSALKVWKRDGIAGRKIAAYAKLSMGQDIALELQQSVFCFGNCYLGMSLPETAQGEEFWEVFPDAGDVAKPGSWGGHCVPVVGYGPNSITIVSWGQVMGMTWNFFRTYCDEAYAVLSHAWIEKSGHAPNGFDYDLLGSDLGEVTA